MTPHFKKKKLGYMELTSTVHTLRCVHLLYAFRKGEKKRKKLNSTRQRPKPGGEKKQQPKPRNENKQC
jgi:hypothetical protein